MNVVSLVAGLLPLVQKIAALWQNSAGFSAIASAILDSPALKDFEAAGVALFPAAEKKIQAVLAAIHIGVPDATKWVQTALNAAQTAGYIHFGDPLEVDGEWGLKTFAAVVVLQAKLGIKVTGAVTDLEYKALNLLLEGKTP
jgi:hypothetical protein